MTDSTVVVPTFRVERELSDRIAALADLMSKASGGAKIPKVEALRAALRRGVDELERELKKPKK